MDFNTFNAIWRSHQSPTTAQEVAIADLANGGFPAIRRHSGLTQSTFSGTFGIPKRTVENWDAGERTPPAYVVMLLAYAVLNKEEKTCEEV